MIQSTVLFIVKGGGSAYVVDRPIPATTRAPHPRPHDRIPSREDPHARHRACHCPVTLAIVIGGTSAERTMKTRGSSLARYTTTLPTKGALCGPGHAFPRTVRWSRRAQAHAGARLVGAHSGGTFFLIHGRAVWSAAERPRRSLRVGLGLCCARRPPGRSKIHPGRRVLEELGGQCPAQSICRSGRRLASAATWSRATWQAHEGKEIRSRCAASIKTVSRFVTVPMIVAATSPTAKLRARLEAGRGCPTIQKNLERDGRTWKATESRERDDSTRKEGT